MANDSLRKNPACSVPTTAESALCETTQVSWQYLSYVHNMTSSFRIKIILYHAPRLPHNKMRSWHRVPPYVRAASPPLPQDWHGAL